MHDAPQEHRVTVGVVTRTVAFYFLGFFVALFCFVPVFILALLLPDSRRYKSPILFCLLDWTYRGVVRAMFIPITVTGREHLPTHPAIFVANHQSSIDIPLLGGLLKAHPHLWYVMAYYAKTPVLGTFVRRMGVFLDREKATQAAHGLIRGMKLVEENGCHLMIFPEGGRRVDGPVNAFFSGFAIIAKKTQRPVIPVYMPYNGRVYPPTGYWVYPHPISIIIGPAFLYLPDETDEQFSDRVRAWFLEQAAGLEITTPS